MSDRKYRQKGYQDSGSGGRERGPRAPREKREGPRGRGLGAPTASVFRCAGCGKRVDVDLAKGVAFDAACPQCGADLHACIQCRHFDPAARWQCREEIPQPVPKKRRANTCELYEPKEAREIAGGEKGGARDARSAFDSLFDL